MLHLQIRGGLGLKAKLFRGLADPSRLAVLEALRSGPCSVSEVVEATGFSQPNVSGHLACLLECGLVTREQRGRFVFYQIAGPEVEALLSQAEEILSQTGASIYACTRYREESHDSL